MKRVRCHKMVKAMAHRIALEVFERSSSIDDKFYKMFRSGKTGDHAAHRFADLNWGNFINEARQALELVAMADDTPEGNKVQIREALARDNMLMGLMADGTHIGHVKPLN